MRHYLFIFTLLLVPGLAQAELKVSPFFGDHMVLQRGQPVPVWGTASSGKEITVSFRDQTVTTRSDKAGKWMAQLPPLSPGEAAALTIRSGKDSVALRDVLVGEVWICSGQSNMEWSVSQAADPEAAIASANHPSIRFFHIPRTYSPKPREGVNATWQVCSPDTVASFSAVGYHFGRQLWNELKVPVGLVSASWGGTRAEAWMPLNALESDPAYREIVANYHAKTQWINSDPKLEATIQAAVEKFNQQIQDLSENIPQPEAAWFDPEGSLEGMQPIQPGVDFFEKSDGLVHVRKIFTLTQEQANRPQARIRLGQIDNHDVTWINGIAVGKTGPEVKQAQRLSREYAIPEGILKPGKNVVLLQIVDVRSFAHFGRNIDQPEIIWPKGQGLPLKEGWEMKVMVDLGPRMDLLANQVNDVGSYLWNGMVAPIVPAAFRGVIWYQGESNASQAEQYRKLFPDLIRAWRAAWGAGDFPFYFVQLANYTGPKGWPELREAQREALALPNTGMAVAIDIGNPDDIHPKNKQDVGKRLALWALAKTYGKTGADGNPIPHSGPLFREAKVEGRVVRLRFDHVEGGLKTRDKKPLTGFIVAEEGGDFRPAKARIEKGEVIVSHPEMKNPRDVRYAWAINPEGNLTNGTGLPASPFRTDKRGAAND